MNTIWVVPIEPLSNRYTTIWYDDIPKILQSEIAEAGTDFVVKTIDGESIGDQTTTGAFLDFAQTNIYKGSQAVAISKLFSTGQVKAGDRFLVTDAWNFVITPIIYMSELLDIDVDIHGIWCAGAHDPTDILGMKVGKEWAFNQERAWFYACKKNYFASDFHKDLFLQNLDIPEKHHHLAETSAHPSIHLEEQCAKYQANTDRTDTIVFTHRLNADKQPEIFRDLVTHLPTHWNHVITQDENLSKEDYFAMLGSSKIVFSCSLHENFGYGQLEGTMCGGLPAVPDRACYSEMYRPAFVYPSEWTESFDKYLEHRDELVAYLVNMMDNYQEIRDGEYQEQVTQIVNHHTYPTQMAHNITKKESQ